MKLLIAGDLFISDSYSNKSLIDNSLINLFANSDYRIVNLESPITTDNSKNKILKTGPHLCMSGDTIIPYLKKLKIDAVTLANNHILDYGVKGLTDTFDKLKSNKIEFVGVGNNLAEASKHLSIEQGGIKIAILNFCENEWSIARKDSPGVNPLDIIDNVNQIKAAKAINDKVICIIHGGHEFYHLPSPRMVKQYRFYADNGADAIIGHHTHCIGGSEIYKDVPIIYSLGNFIFTLSSFKVEWYSGLLVQLIIEKENAISFELFPVKQEKESMKTFLLINEEKEAIMLQVKDINNTISSKDTIQQSWDEFIMQNSKQMFNNISIVNAFSNKYIRAGISRLGIGKLFLNKHYLKLILNLIRCEAHYDLLKSVLEKKLY